MTTARRTHGFRESVIRGMTRLAREHNSLNLAQGFPNFPAPALLKEAAIRAIRADINQYAITWGAHRLRHVLARSYAERYGLDTDPEREITVTCGATEAMISTLLALVNPGEEVIVFEPFYENYGPDTILADARPVYVPLEPGRPLDLDRLAAAFTPRTRAIVVNTPGNPSGRVLTRAELEAIRDLCVAHDALAVTDEIYEHILYTGDPHPDRDAAGDAGAHRHHQRRVEDLQRDGVADRLDPRARRAHRLDPEGPRLPDRRRAGPAPGRSGGRARGARGRLLSADSPRVTGRAAICCRTRWSRRGSDPRRRRAPTTSSPTSRRSRRSPRAGGRRPTTPRSRCGSRAR